MNPVSTGSLTDLVGSAASTNADTELEFVSSSGRRTVRLGELHVRARRVAQGLRELGVGSGDRVTSQLTNRPEAVVLQFALIMLDATLAPVVPVFGAREVEQVLQDSTPTVYVTQRSWNKMDYLSILQEVPAEILPSTVIILDGAPAGYLDWDDLERSEPIVDLPQPDDDSPALIIYTSGSTGVPKGVKHTRRTLYAEALDYDYRPHRNSDVDVYLQGSAAGHIGGYMYPLRAALYDMRTLVLDGWNADLACRLVAAEKVTAMVATPFHAVAMLDLAEKSGYDLSTIDMMMVGGAPVAPSLVRRADSLGVTIVRAYGMSEHPTIAFGRWEDSLDIRAEFDGYLTGKNEVRLMSDGKQVEFGQPGEVEVRGPEQFVGYTNVPDSLVFTEDGWFPTGDIGTIDIDGNLKIVDRKKNIIIRGGENLSATEIENVVASHPSVSDVAVIGVPDERYGERACAFVVLTEGHVVDLDDIRAHFIDNGVAKQKMPEYLELVEALPRTGTGKIRKHELVRMRSTR